MDSGLSVCFTPLPLRFLCPRKRPNTQPLHLLSSNLPKPARGRVCVGLWEGCPLTIGWFVLVTFYYLKWQQAKVTVLALDMLGFQS